MSTSAFPDVVRFADCVDQPWANGGGSTRVIAVGPDDPAAGAFDWRMSVATVTSGDFSRFSGVDRVIVLVDGPPMTLTIDGAEFPLDPFLPNSFRGESMVSCETAQQCFDFNVMTRREVCGADVSIRVRSGHVDVPSDCLTFVIALAGSATVRSASGRRVTLDRFDSVRLSADAELGVAAQARAGVVRVKYAVGRRLG
jgi:uncharacterized protein